MARHTEGSILRLGAISLVNDAAGLAKNPIWALLRRAQNSEMDKINDRRWYTRPASRPNPCDLAPDPTIVNPQCDEFPFYSSEFAGRWDEFLGQGSPVSTSLRWVAQTENKAEGDKISGFFSRCGVPSAPSVITA